MTYETMTGRLQQRCEFQMPVRTRDSAGGVVILWSTYAVRWCDVVFVSGDEQRESGATRAMERLKVIARRDDSLMSSVRPDHRIVFSGRTYGIVSIDTLDRNFSVFVVESFA